MDYTIWKLNMYHLSYKYHRLVSRIWWVPVAVFSGYGLLMLRPGFAPETGAWLLRLAIRLAVLSLLAFIIWIAFSAWYSVWFRHLAWWVACGCGAVWRWLTTGWRGAVVLLAVVTFVMWLRYLAIGFPHPLVEFLTVALGLRVVAVTALLVLLYWAYQAHKRIVILAFTDYTGDQGLTACVEGIAPRLLNELARLADLYRVIDEAAPAEAAGSTETEREAITNATISVEDVGQVLQGAVSAESKVSLGPLQVPIGAILAVVGRVVQGPRLTGGLHKKGDKLVLIAQISGGGKRGNWRVSLDDLDNRQAAPGTETVYKMTDQLAYRFFTDLVRIGSPRWRAVRCYTEGLCLYRETLRTRRDRILKLRKAERTFIRALADDNKFARCHYNLGIVYRDLMEGESAGAAFRQALEADPNQYETYYALARHYYWKKEKYGDVIRFCDQAIRLRPHEARAWDLKGVAQRKLVGPLKAGERPEVWTAIIPTRAIATALAWQALCRSALKGEHDEKLRDIARTCSRNLAVAHAMVKDRRSRAIFQQSLRLVPTDAELYFELGKTLEDGGDQRGAIRAFEDALLIQDRAIYWAYLAHAYASLHKKTDRDEYKKSAQDSCERAIDCASCANEETLEYTKKAWETIGDSKEAARVESIPAVLKALEKVQPESDADYIRRLIRQLRGYRDWDWAYAQVKIKLAQQRLDVAHQYLSSDPTQAKKYASKAQRYLKDAVEKLEKEHPLEIREQGLYGLLAMAHWLLQNKLDQALFYAERAVAQNPDRTWERSILGQVYWALNNHERAETEWNTCLNLDPNPDALRNIASTHWSRGVALRSPRERREAFQRVIEFFNHALEMMESSSLDKDNPAKQMEDRGSVHYWLGQFHRELLDYDKAIAHLKIAQATGFKPLESRVHLGWTYVKAKAYDEAERTFRDAVAEARELRRKGHSFDEHAPQPGEEIPINELLGQAFLYWAFSYADRGIRLERARRLNGYAAQFIPRDKSRRQQYQAALHDCRGWICFRAEEVDKAIKELEQARTSATDAGACYRLARAYMARAQTDAIRRRTRWLAKARDACTHAREADLRGEYCQEIADLLKQLDKAEGESELNQGKQSR